LAILRVGAGANQEAVELYRRVIAAAPENAGAHLNLGFALRSMGRDEEAEAELRRAVELDPRLASRIPPGSTGTPQQ
jgi:Flp pilus assembly protein TadD